MHLLPVEAEKRGRSVCNLRRWPWLILGACRFSSRPDYPPRRRGQHSMHNNIPNTAGSPTATRATGRAPWSTDYRSDSDHSPQPWPGRHGHGRHACSAIARVRRLGRPRSAWRDRRTDLWYASLWLDEIPHRWHHRSLDMHRSRPNVLPSLADVFGNGLCML